MIINNQVLIKLTICYMLKMYLYRSHDTVLFKAILFFNRVELKNVLNTSIKLSNVHKLN